MLLKSGSDRNGPAAPTKQGRRAEAEKGPTPGRRGQSSFRQSPFRRGVRGIPSQQSGSMVVHLEVFTSWATRASPLHRFIDPTARGMRPSAPVSFLRRGDSGEGDSHHLDEESCDGGQTGGIPNLQILQQITDPLAARRGDREGDSHHLGSHHLGAVSGAFPVNNRGRWWFIWRSLRAGRRVRRPDTDLSTPTARGVHPSAPVSFLRRGDSGEGDSHHLEAQQNRDVGPREAEKGTVIIWWSRGQNETTPMKRPRHTLPRLGCPVGARSAPLARGHRA